MMSSVDGEWRTANTAERPHPPPIRNFGTSVWPVAPIRDAPLALASKPSYRVCKKYQPPRFGRFGEEPGEVPCSAGSGAGLRPGGAGGAGAGCRSGRPRDGAAAEI